MSDKEANRARYPEIAAVVDKIREYFPDAKVASIRQISPEKKRMLEEYNARHGTGSRPTKPE